jgi:ligand-binding sensor domain-containing protein
MRRFLLLITLFPSLVSGQLLQSYSLTQSNPLPPSNYVFDIVRSSDTLWFGTNKGLAFTADNGFLWKHFQNTLGFDDKGVSALAKQGNTIWTAVSYSIRQDGERIPAGGGLHVSLDGGATWTFRRQPIDTANVDTILYGANRILSLGITTEANNITYDIAAANNTVWIASFAGMLRKSTNTGVSWEKVILPPDGLNAISETDTLDFHLSPSSGRLGLRGNLNHRVFSVYARNDSVVWVGTANGINKTTDGGKSWRKFNFTNQLQPISGNFVVALAEQTLSHKQIIWAATVNAEDRNEIRGVSFSMDGGDTWSTALLGEFAHNFAFNDSIVYVATDGGLFRSADFGTTWNRSGTIFDPATLQRFVSSQIFSVATKGDTVWVGGAEGIAFTIDSPSAPFGSEWRIYRTYQPITSTVETYAYPTPFSPDDEPVRIHYTTEGRDAHVTIRVFDFSMRPVRTVIRNALRPGQREHDEIWNGRDDDNRRVANGVYFYRVEVDQLEPQWGKIMVLE